ncbi:hypothetical protein [Pseudomonas sp. N2-5-1-1]|uniref:hypothetical protein n=1 Tax=unclassified Pseudomonas TaxID=196821 RepID=UPI0034E0DE17
MRVSALHSRAVPEHGVLGFKDEDSGRSTSVLDRQFVCVPPQRSHSSSSLTAAAYAHVGSGERQQRRL